MQPETITIRIEGDPVPWQRATAVIAADELQMRTPKATRQYQDLIKAIAALEMRHRTPLVGPLSFEVIVTLRRPATVRRTLPWKQGTGDVDNYSKTAQDALNGIAFIDDSQICDLIVIKRYESADAKPALDITISQILDEDI